MMPLYNFAYAILGVLDIKYVAAKFAPKFLPKTTAHRHRLEIIQKNQ